MGNFVGLMNRNRVKIADLEKDTTLQPMVVYIFFAWVKSIPNFMQFLEKKKIKLL